MKHPKKRKRERGVITAVKAYSEVFVRRERRKGPSHGPGRPSAPLAAVTTDSSAAGCSPLLGAAGKRGAGSYLNVCDINE